MGKISHHLLSPTGTRRRSGVKTLLSLPTIVDDALGVGSEVFDGHDEGAGVIG